MMNYVIIESEKGVFIPIKAHSDLLKEFIINIPIVLIDDNPTNELNESSDENINLFYGNTNLSELRKLIHEKYDIFASDINIKIVCKQNENSKVIKILDSEFDNFTLNSIKKNSNLKKLFLQGK